MLFYKGNRNQKRIKKYFKNLISVCCCLFPYNPNLLPDIECGCHNCTSEGLTESLVSVSSRTRSENRVQSNNYGEIVTKSRLKEILFVFVKKNRVIIAIQ